MSNILITIVLLVLVMPSNLSVAHAHGGASDTVKQNGSIPSNRYLDQDTVNMITQARRINIYRLKSFATDVDNKHKKKYFVEYEILAVKKANKKRVSELKSALLEVTNYITDSTNKCTFTATIGLELISKKTSLNVVISYRCDKLLFIRDNGEIYREVKSLERFDRIASELFKGPLN